MSSSPYHQAGKLTNQILYEKKSIKTVAFSKSKLLCTKSTYAQVCNTVQHKAVIDSILKYNSNCLRKAIQMRTFKNEGLVYVLIYELLFGKYKSIRGGGKIKRCIMKFEKELRETKCKILKESQDQLPIKQVPQFPRYVRINKLKASSVEVVQNLKKVMNAGDKKKEQQHDIYQDALVPDLLVLSPTAPIEWHQSELVKDGKIVLQDKSSCFSALALVRGNDDNNLEGDYIDATAAPGNKTLHLASLVYDKIMITNNGSVKKISNNVKVFAFDRSSSRISILKDRLSKLAPSVILDLDDSDQIKKKKKDKNSFPIDICPRHEDFLKVDPSDKCYKNVTSILLDPSCSGSGIVNSPDRFLDATKSTEKEEQRIKSLSNFQLIALKHAMSFPQCMRIVYSTCSIHQLENEDVVAKALHETNGQIDDDDTKWELVSPKSLRHWERRGFEVENLTKEQSKCLIRVNGMDGDETNGFFVSYFERKKTKRSEQSKSSPHAITCTINGVKGIYNGEFIVSQNNIESELNSAKNENDSSTDKEEMQSTKAQVKAKDGEVKKVPKKVAKKLKWKQQQKALKRARLNKKERASAVSK